jgi:hypothetical protein
VSRRWDAEPRSADDPLAAHAVSAGAWIARGARFVVSGSLRPDFPTGATTVSFRLYRQAGHAWRFVKRYAAGREDADGRFRVCLSLAGAGRYRFEMSCAATAETFAAESGFSRILTVR